MNVRTGLLTLTCWFVAAGLFVAGSSLMLSQANAATLVGYWELDGDGNATVGTNGTLLGTSGTPTSTTDRNGVAGGALSFLGTDQQHVDIPGGGGLSGASVGTISLWANWTGIQDSGCCGGGFGPVLGRQSNGVFSDAILALTTADPNTATVRWAAEGIAANITGSTIVGESTWHNLVVTFNGTAQELFIDGVSQGTGVAPQPAFNVGATPLSIGAWPGDGAGYSTSSVDDVGIFGEVLNQAEVRSIYSLSTTNGLQYNLGEANQLIQAFESSAPSVLIGDQLWMLVNDGSLTSPEGEVALGGNLMHYSINFANGNGFAVFVAPEPSSLLILGLGTLCVAGRRRRK